VVGKIKYSKGFEKYLERLIFQLYRKNYFGFIETCFNYVDKIYIFIEATNFQLIKKQTPEELKSKGTHYIKYEANKTTTWYILFDEFKENYYINYIFNNHQEEAKFLK
jgi:hypothetical protein